MSTVLEFSNFEIFGKFIIVVGQFLKNLEKNLEKKNLSLGGRFQLVSCYRGYKIFFQFGENERKHDAETNKRRSEFKKEKVRYNENRRLSTAVDDIWKTGRLE